MYVSGSGFGQGGGFFLLARCGLGGAVLEAEAIVSSLQDMAVMGEPIEQRRRHLGVTEVVMTPPSLIAYCVRSVPAVC